MIQFFKEILDWRVSLDIIVLAALFFTVYKTLRASGTAKIAIGLLLAAFCAMLAGLLDLRGVEWLFANLSQVAVIALLIIFQPEIRRYLEHSIRFGKNFFHPDDDLSLAPLLDEVLFDLSQRRWGALIVLPGNHSMKQWLTEGVHLDAFPSQSLLLSIFDPDSPGHDGAILFDRGKVSRFGVRLPLSDSNSLPQKYGTRHHAALGLSEKTDALVLAVSEERGTISAFHNSSLVELKKKGDLEELLRSRKDFYPTRNIIQRSGKKNNWKLALEVCGSLILATTFWFSSISDRTDYRNMLITVPIEYGRPAPDLILSENRQTEAKLLLEGPSTLLDNLTPSQLRLKVDLAEMAAGNQMVNLTADHIVVPRKVKLLEINPPSLNLELYKLTFSKLPIIPQLIGELQEGHQIENIEIHPPQIEVSFPQEESGPKELLTTPIYLQGIRASTTVFCKIVTPYGVQPKEKRWPDISVKIKVAAHVK